MTADFQIIGGGLIGLSTAYALLMRGAGRVRLLEAREGVALETSFANAGMVHASLAAPWNAPGIERTLFKHMFGTGASMKLRLSALPELAGWGAAFLRGSSPVNHWHATQNNYHLAQYSLGLNRQWREDLHIQDDYNGDGLLKVFRREKEFEQAKQFGKRLDALGLETHYLDGRGAAHKEPALASVAGDIAGALYYPNDFKADAYRFCQALEREIIRLGGEIITGAVVDGFIREGASVIGVKTKSSDYLSKMTIAANGAHAYKLLRTQGLALPVRPVKGYSLSFPVRGAHPHMPKIPVVDDSLHVAITPFEGSIRIAGMAEIAGFNSALPQRSLKVLWAMLQNVYPKLTEQCRFDEGQIWHGFRPVSADGMPFIGLSNISGLAVNTGHGHMGWTLCAGSGAVLADMLLGQSNSQDVRVFDPCRRG